MLFIHIRKKRKKLEILKDPHIGAFSVIMAAVYGLMYTGFLSEIRDVKVLGLSAAASL